MTHVSLHGALAVGQELGAHFAEKRLHGIAFDAFDLSAGSARAVVITIRDDHGFVPLQARLGEKFLLYRSSLSKLLLLSRAVGEKFRVHVRVLPEPEALGDDHITIRRVVV